MNSWLPNTSVFWTLTNKQWHLPTAVLKSWLINSSNPIVFRLAWQLLVDIIFYGSVRYAVSCLAAVICLRRDNPGHSGRVTVKDFPLGRPLRLKTLVLQAMYTLQSTGFSIATQDFRTVSHPYTAVYHVSHSFSSLRQRFSSEFSWSLQWTLIIVIVSFICRRGASPHRN